MERFNDAVTVCSSVISQMCHFEVDVFSVLCQELLELLVVFKASFLSLY